MHPLRDDGVASNREQPAAWQRLGAVGVAGEVGADARLARNATRARRLLDRVRS